MNLVYLTSLNYPSGRANAHQVESMSRAFAKVLAEKFLLVVNTGTNKEFLGIKSKQMNWPFLRGKSFFYFCKFFFKALPFALDNQTIIYLKDPNLLKLANFFKSRFGFKTCAEIHIPAAFDFKSLAKADYFVVLNDYLKKWLQEKYQINEKKILVFPDAVDLQAFDIKAEQQQCRLELDMPQKAKIAGYVGRFKTGNQEKGIKMILEAISLADPSIIFYLVGGNPEEIAEYQAMAENLGVIKQCVFVPFQNFSLLPKYLKAMDVLLMPFPKEQHYEFFMSPLKMFEYMASKRPIVSTTLPSIKQVLNASNSILVEPEDKSALAKAINDLCFNQALADRLAGQAYKDVKNYTWDKRAKAIIDFLSK